MQSRTSRFWKGSLPVMLATLASVSSPSRSETFTVRGHGGPGGKDTLVVVIHRAASFEEMRAMPYEKVTGTYERRRAGGIQRAQVRGEHHERTKHSVDNSYIVATAVFGRGTPPVAIRGKYQPKAAGYVFDVGGQRFVCTQSGQVRPHQDAGSETADTGWAGTWQSMRDPHGTFTLTGDAKSVAGVSDWVVSEEQYSHTKLSNFKVLSSNHLTCEGAGTYVDSAKTIECRASFDLVLSGDTIALTSKGLSRTFKWRPGVTPYESSVNVPGVVAHDTLLRKR